MVHQMERCEDWIHHHIEVNRDIQTHVKYIIIKDLQKYQEKTTQHCVITYMGKDSKEE